MPHRKISSPTPAEATTAVEVPLAGVRVLELGSLIAGPFGARLLSDLGAEVIKVEAPGRPDPFREWGTGRVAGRSLWWPLQTRGKKLVTLDLRKPRGQDVCRRLAKSSDVLVENFRPGTMEGWGLGPEDLLAENPQLVYARVSGFGQTGPYAERPGLASVCEAMAGLRHLNGFPDQAPPRLGLSLGDSLAALFTAIGVLAALHHRDVNGGTGQVVDVSILESCFAMLESVVPEYQKLGVVRGPSGTTVANNAPSNLYRSRDDKWVVISANSDNLWPRLCRAIDRADLLGDPRFASHDGRGRHAAELDEVVGGWAAGIDADEIDRILTAAGVVSGPVYTVEDIFTDPHFRARGLLVPVCDPELGELLGPAATPRFSATPGRREFRAPWNPGEHNGEVYRELLELDADQLDELVADGVI